MPLKLVSHTIEQQRETALHSEMRVEIEFPGQNSFNTHIAKSLGNDTMNQIENSNFYRLLAYESTDSSVTEKGSLLSHDIRP